MSKHLNFGVYKTTENFRKIEQHSCVCFDDMALVAVTGPANDEESQRYAELFAAAPELLNMLELAIRYLEHPDILAITSKMAVPGEAINERINAVIAKATAAHGNSGSQS